MPSEATGPLKLSCLSKSNVTSKKSRHSKTDFFEYQLRKKEVQPPYQPSRAFYLNVLHVLRHSLFSGRNVFTCLKENDWPNFLDNLLMILNQ